MQAVTGIDYYLRKGLHFAIEIGWAILNNYAPLLQAVHQQPETEIKGFLATLVGCSKRYISEDHLIETSLMAPPLVEIPSQNPSGSYIAGIAYTSNYLGQLLETALIALSSASLVLASIGQVKF